MGKIDTKRKINLSNLNDGFTIVEVLAVVAIIGILIAILAPRFTGYRQKARGAEASAKLSAMILAQKSFYIDFKRYTNCLLDTGFSVERYGPGDANVNHFQGRYLVGFGDMGIKEEANPNGSFYNLLEKSLCEAIEGTPPDTPNLAATAPVSDPADFGNNDNGSFYFMPKILMDAGPDYQPSGFNAGGGVDSPINQMLNDANGFRAMAVPETNYQTFIVAAYSDPLVASNNDDSFLDLLVPKVWATEVEPAHTFFMNQDKKMWKIFHERK